MENEITQQDDQELEGLKEIFLSGERSAVPCQEYQKGEMEGV